MAQSNGTVWKGATAALGLLLTATLVVAAANRDWGQQKEKVQQIETTVEKHGVKIDCHDQQITGLTRDLANLLDRQKETNDKLDELLRRMPPVGRAADTQVRGPDDGTL